jgi:ligand-binding sensor domain-containing protein
MSIARDSAGQVHLGTALELARWREDRFQAEWRREMEKDFEVEMLAPSRQGGLWVAGNRRLRRFEGGQWRQDLGTYAWTSRFIYSLREDSRGNLWVATMGDGLFCHPTNGPALRLTRSDGLPTDFVRCVTEDREGNIWAGLENGGLCRLKPAVFQTYGRHQGLSSDQIAGVSEHGEGEFWIGTKVDGLDRLKNGEVRHFGPAEGLTALNVSPVLRDRRGIVWVGSWGGLFKGENDQFTSVTEGMRSGRTCQLGNRCSSSG